MDNRDYVRVLLYSYYTTITGWGVLLRSKVRARSQEVEWSSPYGCYEKCNFATWQELPLPTAKRGLGFRAWGLGFRGTKESQREAPMNRQIVLVAFGVQLQFGSLSSYLICNSDI